MYFKLTVYELIQELRTQMRDKEREGGWNTSPYHNKWGNTKNKNKDIHLPKLNGSSNVMQRKQVLMWQLWSGSTTCPPPSLFDCNRKWLINRPVYWTSRYWEEEEKTTENIFLQFCPLKKAHIKLERKQSIVELIPEIVSC